MVAERVKVIQTSGILIQDASTSDTNSSNVAFETDLTIRGGTLEAVVQPVFVPDDAEAWAFTQAGWEAFAEDWESPEDAVFDDLLKDA